MELLLTDAAPVSIYTLNTFEGVLYNLDRMDAGLPIIVPPDIDFGDEALQVLHDRICLARWRVGGHHVPHSGEIGSPYRKRGLVTLKRLRGVGLQLLSEAV